MNRMLKFYFVIGVLMIAQYSIGQSHILSSEQVPELAIHGTSTLHEWTANAGDVQGIPTHVNLEDGLLSIDALSISTTVESLDGGRGPSMNSKIKKALKGDTHPQVTFVVTDPFTINLTDLMDNEHPISGELMIGGETQSIDLITTIVMKDDQIHISGARDLKMTSFNIEPPSAMFGQIKTNDDITIRFDVHYEMK